MESNTERSIDNELIFQSYPWLSTGCIIDHALTLFNISKEQCYNFKIANIHNKIILSCNHGWLVMKDSNSESFSLLNPISMEEIDLPILEVEWDEDFYVFLTFSSKDCYVLVIDNKDFIIWFCKPGDKKFMKQSIGRRLDSPTSFGGKLYFLSDLDLVTFECKGQEFQLTSSPALTIESYESLSNTFDPYSFRRITYLTSHGDDLLQVQKFYLGLQTKEVYKFNIYRHDATKNVWVKLKNIGSRTIFLSSRRECIICCFAQESEVKQNAIYFVDENDDGHLQVFELEDNSLSMSVPFPNISDDAKEFKWIMFEREVENKNIKS